MPEIDNKKIINATRAWVQSFVIDFNLCPFASKVLLEDLIRFSVFVGDSKEDLLENLYSEIERLQTQKQIATTLLIHPNVLQDFEEYNQFLNLVDVLLEQIEGGEEYQVASFHPDYQFAETEPTDAENYSNRSPFPMLHILRESMVSDAVNSHQNTYEIPNNNIQRLREIGARQLQNQLTVIQNS